MTKPHTTLSEAVRALIKNLPPHIVGHSSAKLGYSAAIDDVLKLVEQHEAQEPVAWQERMRDATHLPFGEWKNCPKSQFDLISKQPYHYGLQEVRELYAQPTLAATQAGDAWISVQDRLPEFDFTANQVSMVVRVIAALRDGTVCQMGYWANGWTQEDSKPGWSFADGRRCLDHHITHWQPLPSAPTTTRSE